MNQTSFPNANLTAALQFSHSLSFQRNSLSKEELKAESDQLLAHTE